MHIAALAERVESACAKLEAAAERAVTQRRRTRVRAWAEAYKNPETRAEALREIAGLFYDTGSNAPSIEVPISWQWDRRRGVRMALARRLAVLLCLLKAQGPWATTPASDPEPFKAHALKTDKVRALLLCELRALRWRLPFAQLVGLRFRPGETGPGTPH